MCKKRFFILLVLLLPCVVGTDEDIFAYAPGVAMDYKIHIDAGKEDCYYQYVSPGATLYISMQVLKGGDGMAGMAVRNSKGEIVHPYQWKQSSEYEETSAAGGYYGVCIDNQFSRFAAKLINLYITTFRYDLWDKYSQELEQLDVSVKNFTDAIQNVDQNVHTMLQYQSHSRARESRDYELLLGNNQYIQYWSCAQCVAIIASSVLQVYCLRKLLDSPSSKTKSRVGA